MRLGYTLPQLGPGIVPETVARCAKGAEDLGFDSLWVVDRLLWPIDLHTRYPVGDGSLPVKYKNALDPLETLTFAAARTRRVALGTSVLNLPWYNPVLLARQLTTLDVLSARAVCESASAWVGRRRNTRRPARRGRIAANAPTR